MKLFSIFKGALPFICTVLLVASIYAQDSGAAKTSETDIAKSFDTPIGYPTPPGSGGALEFDGQNDFVQFETALLPTDGSSWSLEFWGKVDEVNVGTHQNFFSQYGNVQGRFHIYELNGFWIAFFGQSTGNALLILEDSEPNTWTNFAVSFNDQNDSISVYLNGAFAGGAILTENVTDIPSKLGYDGFISPRFLDGQMDELKIWNSALTQSEIRDYMCQKDLSSHPQIDHLAAYYRFDDGAGSSQLQDLSGNGNTGNLVNMDAANSWVTSGAPIGDISVYAQNDLDISLDIGNSFSVVDLSEDIEGVHLYRVDEAPNNASVPSDFSSLVTSEYYGVFAVSDSIPSFTVAYDYENDSNVNNQPNELSVRFAKRLDNSAGEFESAGTQEVSGAVTKLSAANQMNGEYILGFGDFECPALGDDIGEGCDDNDPTTVNDEINANCECEGEFVCTNPFPAVEAASIETTFQGNGYQLSWDAISNQIGCQIAVRFAGGNTLGQQIVGGPNAQSFFVPGSVLQLGTDYEWRVRCGCSQSPIVAGPWSAWQGFTTPGGASIAASPNPTEGFSLVSFSVQEPQYATLEVMDMNGRTIERLFAGNANPDTEYQFDFDGSGLPNGVYIYRLTTDEEVITEKIMISK